VRLPPRRHLAGRIQVRQTNIQVYWMTLFRAEWEQSLKLITGNSVIRNRVLA